MVKLFRDDLLYPELCYKINGVLFRVFRELGPGLLEKHYENGAAVLFREEGIAYKQQHFLPQQFHSTLIGKRWVDFLIEDKIVLELKRLQFISPQAITQILDYLKLLKV